MYFKLLARGATVLQRWPGRFSINEQWTIGNVIFLRLLYQSYAYKCGLSNLQSTCNGFALSQDKIYKSISNWSGSECMTIFRFYLPLIIWLTSWSGFGRNNVGVSFARVVTIRKEKRWVEPNLLEGWLNVSANFLLDELS